MFGTFSVVRPGGRGPAMRTVLPVIASAVIALVLFARVFGALVTALEQRGFALLHQCVPDGAVSGLGLHLAVVRTSADCPAGTLALGGKPDDVAAVVAAITLPVLLLHIGGGFAGFSVLAHLQRSMVRCARLARVLRFSALTAVGLPVVPDLRQPAIPDRDAAVMPPRIALVLAPVRRGPPAVCTG